MPVEDRVKNLEGSVTTLTERLGNHIDQSATDKAEAKRENKERHKEVMTGIDTLGTGIAENARELSNIAAVKEAFQKAGIVTDEFQRPRINGKAKVGMGVGAGGVAAAIVIKLIEMLTHSPPAGP